MLLIVLAFVVLGILLRHLRILDDLSVVFLLFLVAQQPVVYGMFWCELMFYIYVILVRLCLSGH